MTRQSAAFTGPLFAILGLCACVVPPQEAPAPGLANPAAVYCIKAGGALILEGAVGICHLPDGTTVEEWDYFRAHTS